MTAPARTAAIRWPEFRPVENPARPWIAAANSQTRRFATHAEAFDWIDRLGVTAAAIPVTSF